MSELLQFINSLEDPVGKSIVSFIFIAFWIGVINYVIHIVRIGYEFYCLKRVKNYININPGFSDVFPDLLDKLPATKYLKWSIIYRRIRNFVQINQNGGQIDNDVLADIHAGEASRKAGFSSYILGILIILGLIGTLRGLITAIIEVQPLLRDIEDLDQLPTISDALRLTLSGMSTAFVTTLAGLLTSLILGFFGWLFNLANSAFLTEFERFVSTKIIPRLEQTPESSIESAASQLVKYTDTLKFATEENVGAMRQVVQQLVDTSWDRQLEQQYILANKFDATTESLLRGLTEINEGLTEISGNQYSVESIIESFKELMAESMSQIKGYQETLLQGLEDSVPKLEEESDALKTAIEEYQNSQSRFIDDLSSTLQNQLQSITENQQDMVNVLTHLADELQIRSVLERQNQIFERIETELMENQKEMVLVLSQSVLEAQNTIFERIKTQLTENQQEIVSVLTRLTDELQIRSVLVAQNQVFERIETELIGSQREIFNTFTQLAGELQIRSALEAQNQILGRTENHLIRQGDLLAEQRELMVTLITSVQQPPQTPPVGTLSTSDRDLSQQISLKLDLLNAKFDALNDTMRQPGIYRWIWEIRRWFRLSR